MTTSITIHVNGRYRSFVKQDDAEPVTVEGNYEGSPNPDGRHTFWLRHGKPNAFTVTEEQVPEPVNATAQGAVFEVGIAQTPGLESAKKIVAGIEQGEHSKPNEGGLR
jgi:hypothetical protein